MSSPESSGRGERASTPRADSAISRHALRKLVSVRSKTPSKKPAGTRSLIVETPDAARAHSDPRLPRSSTPTHAYRVSAYQFAECGPQRLDQVLGDETRTNSR